MTVKITNWLFAAVFCLAVLPVAAQADGADHHGAAIDPLALGDIAPEAGYAGEEHSSSPRSRKPRGSAPAIPVSPSTSLIWRRFTSTWAAMTRRRTCSSAPSACGRWDWSPKRKFDRRRRLDGLSRWGGHRLGGFLCALAEAKVNGQSREGVDDGVDLGLAVGRRYAAAKH